MIRHAQSLVTGDDRDVTGLGAKVLNPFKSAQLGCDIGCWMPLRVVAQNRHGWPRRKTISTVSAP
jgi:hypothetical protein